MPSARSQHDLSIPAHVWERVVAVMERLASSRDLGEVLQLIIDSMRDCLGADRASVFQYDHASHELFATRAHGVDRSLRFSADLGIAGEAVRTRSIVNVPDCYADPRFNKEIDRQTGYRTRCMLTVPLASFDGGLEGVAQVLNKRGGDGGEGNGGAVFDAFDETIARALASQAAVAIRRARLLEAEKRKNKIEADLKVAREMQLATLPATLPAVRGYDIAASNRQAEETGGDTFDILGLRGGRGALLLMADATGHGIGPALSATQVQAMLRIAVRLGASLEDAVSHLNALMCEALPIGRFVTAFIGMLGEDGSEGDGEDGTNRIRYVSAGQAPILVVRADGSYELRDATTLPLGVDPWTGPVPVETLRLDPGDAFVLLSDGYYEYTSEKGTQFGVERAVEAVRAARACTDGSAQAIIAALDAALGDHGVRPDGTIRPPSDDQTALVIVRRPSPDESRDAAARSA